ncbi:MAG: PTS sugar transporter subunit IIA [Anaerolineales bacterium]
MVGIVVVTHGEMAAGLIQAAEMIVGKQEQLSPVHLLEMDAVEGLMERVEESIGQNDTGEGILLLVDLPGASPFNACARLAMQREGLKLISGVNLPMLAELLVQRPSHTLSELVEIAKQAGKFGIKDLSEILNPE